MQTGKKILLAGAVFCSAFGIFNMSEPPLQATGEIKVYINGIEMVTDVPPLLSQDRTLVPMRAIGEQLGCTVNYDAASKKVTISGNGQTVTLTVNQKQAYINGQEQLLDVPAKVVNGRTLVPLRFVGQSFNATVDWNGATQTVTITTTNGNGNSNNNNNTNSSGNGNNSANYPQSWANSATWEQELLTLVNKARTDLGLNALVAIDDLAALARSHSRDMAVNNFFDHTSPAKGTAEQRMTAAGLPPCLENIAHGYMSPTDTFNALMASPSHRNNLLNPNGAFFGAGAYSIPVAEGKTEDVFVTIDIVTGDSFFIASRNQSVSGETLTVKGYTTQDSVNATAFLLVSGKDNTYAEKQTFPMTVKGNQFSGEIKLWKSGKYIINVGGDNLVITKQ